MRIKPKHVALFGNFGSDNLGNEASLKAMLDFLRRERPDWEITCVCYGIDKARAEHRVATLPITPSFPQSRWFRSLNRVLLKLPFQLRDFLHALLAVRRFDLLIVPGTGILDDFSERWQGMPYDLLKWSLAATLTRRRFAFVSIGAGPIHHPISRRLMTWSARLACYRSYRDAASKDYMLALGVSGQDDPVFPDLVFGLPAPEHREKKADGRPLTIGVGVMHYFGWDRASTSRSQIHEVYISRITQFVSWLHEHGYRVRLLIGALSDQRSFDDILRRVAAQYGQPVAEAIVAEPAFSFDDLMRQMSETDVIVATRFHNIVAALKLGLPAISIGYAEKNDLLLAQAGLVAFCQPIEQLDVARLIAQFEGLIRDREKWAGPIQAATERCCESLKRQNAQLLARLL